MAEEQRRRLRPFPGVRLEFGHDGVRTAVRERIALAKGHYGDPTPPIVRTAGVGELRKILEAAALRHADLSREIAEHEGVLADVRARLQVAQLFVMRLVMADRIRDLAAQGQAAIAALTRARAEREAGKVEVHFSIDTATAAAYAALTRAFEDLAGHGRIWDAGALTADGEVGRVPVTFSVGASDIVACREDVLLAPGGGWSLQIFPGFVLLREAADAVVLEHADLALEVTRARFVEEEAVPGDAKVVGEAWPTEDADADGKEPQAPLPVVEYGELSLNIPTGQLAAYVFSSYAKARVFVEAYEDHKRALAAIVEPNAPEPEAGPRADVAPLEPPLDIKPRARLWMDWAAIVLLVFLLGLPFALYRPAPPSPAAASARAPVAAAAVPEAKSDKAKDRSSTRPAPRPKRAAGKAAKPRPKAGEPCGLVRQPDGVLKLIPCAPAATAPTATP